MIIFSFDGNRCSGCYACVVACQDQNERLEDDPLFRQVSQWEENSPSVRIRSISIACYHCGDAPCLMACPTGAIFRYAETGIVDVNRDLCVGCHSCELVCPFAAPKFAVDGRMAKCDLCVSRIAHGMDPACVHTCPTRALTFGDASALSDAKAQQSGMRLLKAAVSPNKAR